MAVPGEIIQKPEKKRKRQSAFMRAISRLLGIPSREKLVEELSKKDLEKEFEGKLTVKEQEKPKEALPLRERIRKATVDAAINLLKKDPREKINPTEFKDEIEKRNRLTRSAEGVPQAAFRKTLAEGEGKSEEDVKKGERAVMLKAVVQGEVDFGVRTSIEGKNVVLNLDSKSGEKDLDDIQKAEEDYVDKAADIEDKEGKKARIREEIALLKEIREAKQKGESADSETTKKLIEKVETFLSGGSEPVLLGEMLDTYGLDEESKKKIDISVITEVTGATGEESAAKYEQIRDKTARKPLHAELLGLAADKLITKHNDAREFYGGGPEEVTEEVRVKKDQELRGIVNEALGTDLDEGNTVLQVPGGVAIVTSSPEQFSRMVNMGEDHEAISQNLKEQPVAGAYLKGDLAKSIEEKGYKGDVMIIYSKDAKKDMEESLYDKSIKENETRDLIYHEVEHLLQKRTLESIEDLHSGSDKVLEKNFKESKLPEKDKLLAIYRDIREKGKESEYYKQAPDDPIFRMLAEGRITTEAGMQQLISLYYGSKGIDFDAVRSIERRGLIFEDDPSMKGITIDADKVFEFAESKRKITTENGVVIDPWEDIAKENPLLQAVYDGVNEGGLSANDAKAVYKDFSDDDKLVKINDELGRLMEEHKLTSISQLVHKISKGEIGLEGNQTIAGLELIKMVQGRAGDTKFVKRAAEILGSIFKDNETRDALFEYSAILSGSVTAFGEGLMDFADPANPLNSALLGLYKNILGEESKGPGDVSLRRIYLRTPEGEIPEEHLKLFKFMVAVDMILQKAKNNSDEEFDKNRRHIMSMIYTEHNKGVDYLLQKLTDLTEITGYLNKEQLAVIDGEIGNLASTQDQNALKEIVYGKKENYQIPYNPNVDFSVFPAHRYIKDIMGASNANSTIDIVDALQRTYAFPFAAMRHKDYESQARDLEAAGAPDYLVKAVRMRSPFHRGGEESSIDSTWYMKIVESLPLIGGFVTPGKVEWAKSSLFTDGHPQYGRSMKRVPIIGPIIERHFPVVLETGLGGRFDPATGKFEAGWGSNLPEMKFDSAQLITGAKNVNGVLQGMQIGLDGLGMDELEKMAFLKAMPMFRTVQMSQASPPQTIYSQAALEDPKKQIWADRSGAGGDHRWEIDFKNEILWGEHWDGTRVTVDDDIANAQAKLAGFGGLDRLGKKALGTMKGIKELNGVKKEAETMRKIYDLMEAQKNLPEGQRYTMRHLVEMARKAHEGMFWDPDPTKPREYYFKVGIPGNDGNPVMFDLKDVNTFVQRYNRAYAKEIFWSGKDPNTDQALRSESPIVESYRFQSNVAEKNIADLTAALNDPNNPPDPATKLQIQRQIAQLTNQKDALDAEIAEIEHEYTFIEGFKEGYDKEKFFDIVWSEVDGYTDNMRQGMEYFTNYQFRVTQTAMIERRTFLAATFFNRLDRILNNIGHWSLVAGVALPLLPLIGLPALIPAAVGINLVLAGAGIVLADTIFVNKYAQLWLGRRIKALEIGEKLDGMLQMYEDVQSGKFLTPANLDFLERQKARIEFMTESIMKVTAKDSVKFPADRPLFAITAGALALFDQYGINILSGKI